MKSMLIDCIYSIPPSYFKFVYVVLENTDRRLIIIIIISSY